jgi:hypothetical protein
MTIEQTVEIPADRQLKFPAPVFRPSKSLRLNSKNSIPPKLRRNSMKQ